MSVHLEKNSRTKYIYLATCKCFQNQIYAARPSGGIYELTHSHSLPFALYFMLLYVYHTEVFATYINTRICLPSYSTMLDWFRPPPFCSRKRKSSSGNANQNGRRGLGTRLQPYYITRMGSVLIRRSRKFPILLLY